MINLTPNDADIPDPTVDMSDINKLIDDLVEAIHQNKKQVNLSEIYRRLSDMISEIHGSNEVIPMRY